MDSENLQIERQEEGVPVDLLDRVFPPHQCASESETDSILGIDPAINPNGEGGLMAAATDRLTGGFPSLRAILEVVRRIKGRHSV